MSLEQSLDTLSSKMLVRYWFEFDKESTTEVPMELGLGCGVTAYDYNDAVSLIREIMLDNTPLPKIKRVVANVDIRTLEINHVQRGMGICVWRGIWWPALNRNYIK